MRGGWFACRVSCQAARGASGGHSTHLQSERGKMAAMEVRLRPELRKFIEDEVTAGNFASADEVVEAARWSRSYPGLRGDEAVLEYTARWDHVQAASMGELELTQAELKAGELSSLSRMILASRPRLHQLLIV